MGQRYSEMSDAAKAAHLARNKKWQKLNKAKTNAGSARRSAKSRLLNPEAHLFYAAKARAKAAGIEFRLSKGDIVIPTHCPVLGTAWGKGDTAPSLDRKYPQVGYVRGNVFVISWRANKLKGNGTPTELAAVARYSAS